MTYRNRNLDGRKMDNPHENANHYDYFYAMQPTNPQWESLTELIEQLKAHIGKTIQVDEAITQHPGYYDRHFTSYGRYTFVLQNVALRTSGARLMLHGYDQGYEIATGSILNSIRRLETNTWELIEHLAETVHRRTFVKVLV